MTKVKGLIEVVYGDGVAQVSFDKVANVELYNRVSTPVSNCSQSSIPPTSQLSNPTSTSTSIAPVPEITPTVRPIYPDYISISLDSLANYAMENLARPLSGEFTFDGVEFTLLAGSKSVFHTQDQIYTSLPTSGSLTTSIVGAKNVYVLINGDYIFKSLDGKTVGKITLSFSDGSTIETNLVAGENIRENWGYDSGATGEGSQEVITTLSPTDGWSNVYREAQSRGSKSATAFIDMITIDVGASKSNLELTKITISDLSTPSGLWVYAVTVGTK